MKLLTNSHVRSHRATTVFRPGFTLVLTKASNKATCLSTSSGCASASASSLETLATTAGGGTPVGLRKREARENGRDWGRTGGAMGSLCTSTNARNGGLREGRVDSERNGGRECRGGRMGGIWVRHTPSLRTCGSSTTCQSTLLCRCHEATYY